MMLRLMKREPVWPMIPYLAAASLALTAWASRGHAAVVSGMYVSMSVALLSVARIWQRGTLFEAALPVDARELLGARVAALLLYVWTPIVWLGWFLYAGKETHTVTPNEKQPAL